MRRRLLAGCLAVSVAAHLGAALLASSPQTVERSAAPGGDVSIVGSIEEMVAGTRVPQPVEPAEMAPVAEAVEVARAVAASAPLSPPVPPASPVPAPMPRMVLQAPAAVAVPPAQADVAAADAVPPVAPAETAQVAPSPAVRSRTQPSETVSPVAIAAATPAQVARVAPALAATIVAARPVGDVAAPIPDAKPEVDRTRAERPVETRRSARAGGETSARKGAEERTAKGRAKSVGTASSAAGDGGRAALSNYQGRVLRKLQRAKRYPPSARARRIEGVAHLSFRIARGGAVSGVRIARSSGEPLLDAAVLDMIRRAAPMPPIPTDISRAPLTITVPVRFDVR